MTKFRYTIRQSRPKNGSRTWTGTITFEERENYPLAAAVRALLEIHSDKDPAIDQNRSLHLRITRMVG